ncbi:MAG TPA: glycerol-3-phosphate 1-O-acyltransferase PlsY [Oscillospiraceae bacterium]|nr:glycerol-3-phosphate 1-O-acyltransferase PlsY [Oscillospiraceae bacterium]
MKTIMAFLAAYLIGSISFGYLAGKLIKGIDIRNFGSGNAGTTNIQRTLGTMPAIIVLLLDISKGLLVVWIARALTGSEIVQMAAGVTAIVGHNWPLFFRFRGGRGIATSIGVLLGVAPLVLLIAASIGVSLIALTRYVSLGSITGALAIPIIMIHFHLPPLYLIFGAGIAMMAIWRHRENISRLLRGTERKLGKKANMGNEVKK